MLTSKPIVEYTSNPNMDHIITTPDKIYSQDGLELDSVLFEPKKKTKKAIIHIHGITGHYLQNHFISFMAREYPKSRYAFLTFNNRGHDYIADIIKTDMAGGDRIQKGSAFDILEECVMDILPAMDYLKKRGYQEIILQGHSLGVLKVVYFLSTVRNHGVSKALLLSPMDVIHLLNTQVKDWKSWRNMAKTMIDSGRGQQFMGIKIWLDVPICADTFWNCTQDDSNMWSFNFTNPGKDFIHYQDIRIPTLVVLPEQDTYAEGVGPEIAKKELEKSLSKKYLKVQVVPKSGHSYWGREEELLRLIIEWLKKHEK